MKKLSKDILVKKRDSDTILFWVSDEDFVLRLDNHLKDLPDFLKEDRSATEIASFMGNVPVNAVEDLLSVMDSFGAFGKVHNKPKDKSLYTFPFGTLSILRFEDFLPSQAAADVYAFNCACNCCSYSDSCSCGTDC